MTQQLFDNGETFALENDVSGATYEVGLYNDSTDNLNDAAGYGDITTEPSGGSYTTESQSTVTVSTDGNNDAVITLDPVTFDVSDSSNTIDSVYVRDNASGDLLFANGIGSQDLSTKDGALEVSNIGFSLD